MAETAGDSADHGAPDRCAAKRGSQTSQVGKEKKGKRQTAVALVEGPLPWKGGTCFPHKEAPLGPKVASFSPPPLVALALRSALFTQG